MSEFSLMLGNVLSSLDKENPTGSPPGGRTLHSRKTHFKLSRMPVLNTSATSVGTTATTVHAPDENETFHASFGESVIVA